MATDDQMKNPVHLPTSGITPPCPRSEKELTKESVTVMDSVGKFLIKFTSSYLEPDVKQSFHVAT